MPKRIDELLAAWRTSRKELLAGRIDSIAAVRERRMILAQAEAEGLTLELLNRIDNVVRVEADATSTTIAVEV